MSKSEMKRLAAHMSDKDRADRLAARCASQIDKIAEQDARIRELEEALRPFANFACGCGKCFNCIARKALEDKK